MFIPTDCMHTSFLHLRTVCGGTGVITPSAGGDILIMVGDGTVGMVQAGLGVGLRGGDRIIGIMPIGTDQVIGVAGAIGAMFIQRVIRM